MSNGANALSSSVLKSLYGRYYQVGDKWRVATFRAASTAARMTDDPSVLAQEAGTVGIFDYEVTQVKPGATPEVLVKVTQVEAFGAKRVDPKVQHVTLKMNDQLQQSEKSYALASSGSSSRLTSVRVASNGLRSTVSPLELYPLDVPDVVTAERSRPETLPTLPKALKPIVAETGFQMNASKSFWFDQGDFFGRSIQVLWQQGEPWPSYMKTPHGVAILIGKGGA